MKKQLFLIVLLAFFAGISSVNAQCVGNGFNPSAGQPYTYDLTITGPGYTGNGTYDWYVTQDVNIINTATIIPESNTFFTVNSGGGLSTYHASGATTNQIGLTWTTAAVTGGNPFYLVLRYSETNANANPACTAENIRVWQINPINTFLLAITGATETGLQFDNANQCPAPLISALITPGTPTTVNYTYGTNTLYYRVVASGANGTWTPSLRIPALLGSGQNYVSVEWTADLSGTPTWHTFNVPAGNTAGGDFTSTDAATITDPTNGTPIFIRIAIANVNWETLADQSVNIGIDGLLPNGLSDIWGGTGPIPDPCAQADPFAKNATYTILARPTINPGGTMPAFIQKLP
ncbi:MAG TPA: hypothetical protein PLK82_05800 [Bacteroidales bacterium]|nr:hypothetical protein [Bacteroidales bacterium]